MLAIVEQIYRTGRGGIGKEYERETIISICTENC
jgi:hypothetical protein